MRQFIAFSIVIGIALAALWLAIDGAALAVGMGAVFIFTVMIVSYWVGWKQAMRGVEMGSNIALQAQASDDKRDTVQINALSGLVRETLKIGHQGAKQLPAQSQQPQFPPLLDGGDVVDGNFVIRGLDDNPQ